MAKKLFEMNIFDAFLLIRWYVFGSFRIFLKFLKTGSSGKTNDIDSASSSQIDIMFYRSNLFERILGFKKNISKRITIQQSNNSTRLLHNEEYYARIIAAQVLPTFESCATVQYQWSLHLDPVQTLFYSSTSVKRLGRLIPTLFLKPWEIWDK